MKKGESAAGDSAYREVSYVGKYMVSDQENRPFGEGARQLGIGVATGGAFKGEHTALKTSVGAFVGNLESKLKQGSVSNGTDCPSNRTTWGEITLRRRQIPNIIRSS